MEIENDYQRFKHLLEYFVAHLEYCNLSNPESRGYTEYIKGIEKFIKAGQGYAGHAIQKQIAKWESYNNNQSQICINVNPKNYKSRGCYLNWKDTAINIIAIWHNNKISYLQQVSQKSNSKEGFRIASTEELTKQIFLGDLGLFDNKDPNAVLKQFYVDFYKKFNEELFQSLSNQLKSEHAMENINKYTKLLTSKKNIILQGAPGTGKTYTTASIAVAMCNPDYSDFANHEKVMEEYKRLQQERQIEFCTFHQSMDYEDFIEGLKPQVNDDKVEYVVENGIFKRICKIAQTNEKLDIVDCIDKYLQTIKGFDNKKEIPSLSGKSKLYVWWNEGNNTISTRSVFSKSEKEGSHSPSSLNIEKVKLQAVGDGIENNWRQYAEAFIMAVKVEYKIENQPSDRNFVFIIDEINRGNVSKIFGELITLLEADKRIGANHPITLILPYSKEPFAIPSNLYIIGTMNTTDRSTGTIDYAVRRRFAFVTLPADDTAIHDASARLLFENVKDFIDKNKVEDINLDDLMVGHSYFMAKDREELKLKLEYEVIPLIKEYIKDGLLNDNKEKESYFSAWREGNTYAGGITSQEVGEE